MSTPGGKKYDLAIMNPPYDGNLHLKILEKVIPVAEETINISPTGYLHDIAAIRGWKKTTFQKFEDTVAKHIKKYHPVTAREANIMFGIGAFASNSITHYDNKEHNLYKTLCYKNKLKSFYDKVIEKVHNKEIDNIANNISKLSTIHGNPGAKDEFDIVTPQIDIAIRFKPDDMSKVEYDNWHKSCQTLFMKYCNYLTRVGQHLITKLLPFMADYTKPWDNKRFCDYFKITGYISDTEAEPNSEWEEILSSMSKYK